MSTYPFYTSCPSCFNRTKYHWYHSYCGGSMSIWSSGDLECQRCYKSGFILDWSFNCGSHGESTFLGPNPHRMIKALVSLSELNMPMKTVFDIIRKIGERNGL